MGVLASRYLKLHHTPTPFSLQSSGSRLVQMIDLVPSSGWLLYIKALCPNLVSRSERTLARFQQLPRVPAVSYVECCIVLMTNMATGSLLQASESVPRTSLECWRIEVKNAIHFWRYLDESESLQHPQSTVEKYFLGLPTACIPTFRS